MGGAPGLLPRLRSCGEGHLLETIGAPLLLGRVEQRCRVEVISPPDDSVNGSREARPEGVAADPAGRDDADADDGDPTAFHVRVC